MPINLIAAYTYTTCLPRAVGGARARFLKATEEQVRRSFLSFAFSFSLFFPPLLPRFLAAARSQSVLAGLSSDRAAAKCVSRTRSDRFRACYSARVRVSSLVWLT